MSKHYKSEDSLCPFYRYEDALAVSCEGVGEGTSIRLFLKGAEYKKKYCRDNWKQCKIAQMLWDKY